MKKNEILLKTLQKNNVFQLLDYRVCDNIIIYTVLIFVVCKYCQGQGRVTYEKIKKSICGFFGTSNGVLFHGLWSYEQR